MSSIGVEIFVDDDAYRDICRVKGCVRDAEYVIVALNASNHLVIKNNYQWSLKQIKTPGYLQGYKDAMSYDKLFPYTFNFMGKTMEQLAELVTKDMEKEFKKKPIVSFDTENYPEGVIIEVDGRKVYQKQLLTELI